VLILHASRRLAGYLDGQLSPAEAKAVRTHLAHCARCRRELDEMRVAAALVRQLAVRTAPASLWSAIDDALAAPRPRSFSMPALRWATACLVAIIAVGAAAYWYSSRVAGAWEVALDDRGPTRMAEGEWIETAASSRARITVGDIGIVDVAPETRVQLGSIQRAQYRLALTRGTISARISAPPRLFFVETPASTVVDLGCAYTVRVDDEGAGLLRVTEGWASLEWNEREALVPAGAFCRTRPNVGPGTPSFEDAPTPLQQALDAFDFGGGGSEALDIVLTRARLRDTLTLWHLLTRADVADRPRVFDRIATLTPLPATVLREKVLQLDPQTLTHLREELAWKW
jgi:predicted anti-sigma-YlaC factor YlaD